MAPPQMVYEGAATWDFNAPLSRWTVLNSFDSAQDCEDWKANEDAQANQIRPTFDIDQCIASDDPRLLN